MLTNQRLPNESFDEYKTRLREGHKAVKVYLQTGRPCLGTYKNGPDRTHQPHEVVTMVIDREGKLSPAKVIHPGTLYRRKAKPWSKAKIRKERHAFERDSM